MVATSKRVLMANIFGTFGYISCLFLWMWVIMHYLPSFLGNEQIKEFLLPAEGVTPAPTQALAPSPALTIFAFVITSVIITLTVFILLRAPITIAKTGHAITKKAAISIEPLVTHNHVLPPKKRRKLTIALIKLVKLLLVLIPVLAGLLTAFVSPPFPYDMIVLVTSLLAAMAVFWFGAQYITAYVLSVKPENLV